MTSGWLSHLSKVTCWSGTDPGLESQALSSPTLQQELGHWCQLEHEKLPETGPLCLNLPPLLAAGVPVATGKLADLPQSDIQEQDEREVPPKGMTFSFPETLCSVAHGGLTLRFI